MARWLAILKLWTAIAATLSKLEIRAAKYADKNNRIGLFFAPVKIRKITIIWSLFSDNGLPWCEKCNGHKVKYYSFYWEMLWDASTPFQRISWSLRGMPTRCRDTVWPPTRSCLRRLVCMHMPHEFFVNIGMCHTWIFLVHVQTSQG